MELKNIFASIPANLEQEYFETLLNSHGVTIERIVSKGHVSPETGWYDQERNEWVMVIQGTAVLDFFDQSPIRLNAGDFIEILAHSKHRVAWTDPDIETIWLAIHYGTK